MHLILNKYEPVIGLEVHAQLLTRSKIFCGCSTEFGSPPNTNVCPVCMGHPGVLPVLNKVAIEYIIKMGIAVNCNFNFASRFARKNYFYPDLPKGYQISQFELPFCENGIIDIDLQSGGKKKIRIKRIHLEEDAGKLIHEPGGISLVDLNRCGIPLIEIVTEPDLSSASEAYAYLSKIKQIVKYLDICDGNMEEGSLRCDANISVRLKNDNELGIKTEVKNMNSFRNVEKAIEFEIARQIDIIEDGGRITQETLLWNADLEQAFSMRGKEEAHDYRYFPEPDLLTITISDNLFKTIKKGIPELPDVKKDKFIKEYALPSYDAEILTSSKEIAHFFEEVIKFTSDKKAASNWVMRDVLAYLKESKTEIADFPVTSGNLAELINFILSGDINTKIARDVFADMIREGKSSAEIIKGKKIKQVTDIGELSDLIDEMLNESQPEVNEYISGKEKVIGFFVGKVMKETSGKANPGIVNNLLKQKLDKLKLNSK